MLTSRRLGVVGRGVQALPGACGNDRTLAHGRKRMPRRREGAVLYSGKAKIRYISSRPGAGFPRAPNHFE